MQKIRIYSPFLPYPITEGAFRVIFDQALSLMALGHSVELVTWNDSPAKFKEKSALWKKDWPSPTFTPLGFSAHPPRLQRVLTSLISDAASPELFYYPNSVFKMTSHLGPCDLAIYHYSFAHSWLKNGNQLPHEKKRAVHFHNLESDLFHLRAENSSGLARWVHLRNASQLRKHENELSQLCHELWFLSPPDLSDYSKKQPSANSRLVPPTYSGEFSKWRKAPLHSTTVLGFIGGFGFQPNRDSAQWILDELVPALDRQGFKGRIQFMGKGASDYFRTKPLPASLEILPDGYDVEKFFDQLSWMMVPHFSGSGVRIKLLDAVAKKIPVLATPQAVERLHPELQHHPLIFVSAHAADWASRLKEEKPLQTRKNFESLPFPSSMSGAEVYSFV